MSYDVNKSVYEVIKGKIHLIKKFKESKHIKLILYVINYSLF